MFITSRVLRRARLAACGIVLGFLVGTSLTAMASEDATGTSPAQPVARLTNTLLETMKEADRLGFSGRQEKLAPTLRQTFDFRFMARLSIGSYWRKLDAGERERFVELFSRMSVATFAARFDGYGGQSFKVLAPRDGPRGTRLVPTKLIHPEPDKEPVTISYLMREQDSAWKAVDVYLKGTYSELATKRSEYSSVIRREGYEALIGTLEARIAELRAQGTAESNENG